MKDNERLARDIARKMFIPYIDEFVDALCLEIDYAAETHGTDCCVFVEDTYQQFEILHEEIIEAKTETRKRKKGEGVGWFVPEDRQTNYKLELTQVAATVFQMWAAQKMKEEGKSWES